MIKESGRTVTTALAQTASAGLPSCQRYSPKPELWEQAQKCHPFVPMHAGVGRSTSAMISPQPLSQTWSLWDTGVTSKGQTSYDTMLLSTWSEQSSASHLPWIMDPSPALKAEGSGVNLEATGEQSLPFPTPQHASSHLPDQQMMVPATTREKPKVWEYLDS